MNPGQEMFYNFFMARTADDKKTEAETILAECFKKQNEGTFDREYLEKIKDNLFAVIKPEAVEELKAAMSSFASKVK